MSHLLVILLLLTEFFVLINVVLLSLRTWFDSRFHLVLLIYEVLVILVCLQVIILILLIILLFLLVAHNILDHFLVFACVCARLESTLVHLFLFQIGLRLVFPDVSELSIVRQVERLGNSGLISVLHLDPSILAYAADQGVSVWIVNVVLLCIYSKLVVYSEYFSFP